MTALKTEENNISAWWVKIRGHSVHSGHSVQIFESKKRTTLTPPPPPTPSSFFSEKNSHGYLFSDFSLVPNGNETYKQNFCFHKF